MTGQLLRVNGLIKYFGGVRAVDGLTASVREGGITGFVEHNGTGKTTMFNIVTGFLPPESGRMKFKGEDIAGLPPHVIPKRGIARTFQNLRSFPEVAALDNVVGEVHATPCRREPPHGHLSAPGPCALAKPWTRMRPSTG